MENGVTVPEGTQDGAGEKVLGVRNEEQAVAGYHEINDSEGDEQFEEAVEEGVPKIGSEEGVYGDVEKIEDSGSGIEVENFDEVAEAPVELLNGESSILGEVTNDQLDSLLGNRIVEDECRSSGIAGLEVKEHVDGEEAIKVPGEAFEKVETGVIDHRNETIYETGEGFEKAENGDIDHGNETINVTGEPFEKDETGIIDFGDVTVNVAGEAFEKAENGVISHESSVNYDAVYEVDDLVKQGHELRGTMSDAEVGSTVSQAEPESNGLIGLQDDLKVKEVNEAAGVMDNEPVNEHVKLQSTSSGSSSDLDVEGRREDLASLSTGTEADELSTKAGITQEDVEEEKVTVYLDNSTDAGKLDISLVDKLTEDSKRSELPISNGGFDGSEPGVDEKAMNHKDELSQNVTHGKAVFLAENSDGAPPRSQDSGSEVFKFVVYEHENKEGEANRSISQNRDEQNVQHAAVTSSSSDTFPPPSQLAGPPPSSTGSREPERIQRNRGTTTETSSSSVLPATSVPAPPRPAGLGRTAPLLEPAPRTVQQSRVNGTVSPVQDQLVEDSANGDGEETDETREKLQMIRVKFLRLAHRLGQTPHNVVVAQVLYRLGLAEQLRGRNGGRVAAFSFDRASAMAEQLESAGQEPLDFSCTIMVLGKSGVGKSATINSIFDEIKFNTDAFHSGTKKVQDVVGMVQGIKVRVIDTPGLLPSWSDQRTNEKILHSIKQHIKKTPPDIVLYLDRLDMPSREFGDMPLLRTITDIFGPSVWFNAIVVLTHAASAPPEGPNGIATSYDMFVSQRSQVVQQAIRQAAGDMRLMNPVSLVENHSACRTNRAGQRVLPNGQVWKPHLLLLSFASKILAEANTLLKLQDSPPGKVLASRSRSPPLPFLLSSLLQSRPTVKLPTEQFDDDDDVLDDELNDSSDSDDESEYDELPPFKRLTKAQLANLSKDQRKAYYKELEYREKLFMRKQLKEERKRRKMMKKMQTAMHDLPSDYQENAEEESAGAGSVPVPMPDLALPASFDSDNPTHRYRYLDSSSQWLVRPVLDTHGWDHDVGYEGINLERLFVVKDKIPVSFSGQISKDKKDANMQMEMASTVKHSEGKTTSLGFDLQSVGKDIAYTLRSETRFSNCKKNKVVAGLAATLLGDVLTGGLKIEDKLIVNKQAQLVMSAGAMLGRGDVAYGGSLEATLRDKDHPVGRFLTTLGMSVMDWHGDLAIGYTCQSQIPIGRATNLIGRFNVNNRGSGQVSIRVNSSDFLQIALIGFVPFIRKMFSQQGQFG